MEEKGEAKDGISFFTQHRVVNNTIFLGTTKSVNTERKR